MRLAAIVTAILMLTPVLSLAADPPPPRLIDTDGPAEGVRPLTVREIWRVGGEDEDVIFGRIVDVKRHADGSTYILDNQLCQVVVVPAGGGEVSYLSREGDGPGELRQPMALVFLPDDLLGVGMGFPGKLVVLERDGTPVTSLFPVGEPAEGNVGIMMSAQQVDGVLVASGGRMVFDGPETSHTDRFLAVADAEPDGFTRVLERATPLDPTGRTYVEADNYYFDLSWALGPGGLIYAPLERDKYEVSVHERTGRLLRVFGREQRPRARTPEEIDEVSPLINVGGRDQEHDWDIADHDPAISRILVDPDDGAIWVLSPHGNNDQPDGILETWDVFAASGEFLRQVPIPLGHEMNDGTCYLVGGGRLVVVKGTGSSFDSGDEEGPEEEVEPLEVICYEMQPGAVTAHHPGRAR